MILMPTGFWSYARKDDTALNGHIVRLSERLAAEFQFQTDTALEIFLDRNNIEWGDAWREKIDTSIHGTTFFIPIITPAYLNSSACRDEFIKFWGKSKSSGLRKLILPIIYTEMPLDLSSDDEIVRVVSSLQYEDWSQLRLEDENSSEYRKGINRLATRLRDVAESIAKQPEDTSILGTSSETLPASKESNENRDKDEPGWLDRISYIEDQFSAWQEAAEEIEKAMTDTAAVVQSDQYRRPNANASTGARIAALKRVANALDEPTQRLLDSSEKFSEIASSISDGIDAASQMARVTTIEDREKAIELADTIKTIIDSIKDNVVIDDEFENSLKIAGQASRDMREPARRVRSAIYTILDTATTMQQWVDSLQGVNEDESTLD